MRISGTDSASFSKNHNVFVSYGNLKTIGFFIVDQYIKSTIFLPKCPVQYVRLTSSRMLTSAPDCSNKSTTSRRPCSVAKCNGVCFDWNVQGTIHTCLIFF